MVAADAEAAAASAIKEIGWLACRQAPMSKGCNSAPSKRRLTPGNVTSRLSASSGSVFAALTDEFSPTGLVAATYTGVRE